VKKREEFLRAHGVEPGFLTGSWVDKFGTVEGDRAREKAKAEREGVVHVVDREVESPVAMEAVAQGVGMGGAALGENAGVEEVATAKAAPSSPPMEKRRGKIFGIW